MLSNLNTDSLLHQIIKNSLLTAGCIFRLTNENNVSKLLPFFVLAGGCSTAKIASEYGSSTAVVMFACAGAEWTSSCLDETFCLMQGVNNPIEYILGENTAESYAAAVAAGLTFGLSLLFDGDTRKVACCKRVHRGKLKLVSLISERIWRHLKVTLLRLWSGSTLEFTSHSFCRL